MTRPDLKMFDLLRENVFLKLPVHLYIVFLVICETAKNPMGVDNITDVAERVHHELIGGIPRSSLPWFRPIVEFPLSSCAPLSLRPWTTQFGSNARYTLQKTKEHFILKCATRIFLLISIGTRLHGELPSCFHATASWHE